MDLAKSSRNLSAIDSTQRQSKDVVHQYRIFILSIEIDLDVTAFDESLEL
ncbi:MAG: hypothetical protein ACJARQ_000972 [Oleispira sp.]|jgi:hypothetical protein